jgi:hypothetical protein
MARAAHPAARVVHVIVQAMIVAVVAPSLIVCLVSGRIAGLRAAALRERHDGGPHQENESKQNGYNWSPLAIHTSFSFIKLD